MEKNMAKKIIEKFLAGTDIQINGSRPWDIQVHNEKFYWRVLKDGSLGLGESYMDGWWDCEEIDELINKILNAQLDKKIKKNKREILRFLFSQVVNLQSRWRAFQVGKKHYDVGNELYQAMLDKTMTYSCAYWKDANDLEQAQQNKLKLICEKLQLKPGMRLLDVGCGWGGLAKYAVDNYGVEVTGLTVSKEQKKYADEYCRGLPIQIFLQDYRKLKGDFDRIVSVGMFEHVGNKNYSIFMKTIYQHLKDNGLFLLHTIGNNYFRPIGDPWISKYIFPNGILPSIKLIVQATEKLFIMEDWHNFGADYDKTLMSWYQNFQRHWPELKSKFNQRFYRMWRYYLLASAGSFRARDLQLWQVVFSKQGVPGGYQSVR